MDREILNLFQKNARTLASFDSSMWNICLAHVNAMYLLEPVIPHTQFGSHIHYSIQKIIANPIE